LQSRKEASLPLYLPLSDLTHKNEPSDEAKVNPIMYSKDAMLDILKNMKNTNVIALPQAYQPQIDSKRILKSPCFNTGYKPEVVDKIIGNFKMLDQNQSVIAQSEFACLKVTN